MMLLIDGINKGIHYENVTHLIQSYESAFELLNQLVADQWTLTAAILVDNGDCMSLPVEAFDGQPIQIQIQSMEQEWTQLLLAKPSMPSKPGDLWLKDWYIRLDEYYGDLLGYLEKMILLLETRKVKLLTHRSEKMKLILSSKYEFRLEMNKRLYQQTQKDRQKNQQRLLKLEK